LKRAQDELKYQNDENIRTINTRNEQLAISQQETLEMRLKCEERDRMIDELKLQVQDLELRNRQLNDRVNEVIYSKASEFKNKTIEKLKHSCENVKPNRACHRQGDIRLAQTLVNEN
jgi:hypothetical protein